MAATTCCRRWLHARTIPCWATMAPAMGTEAVRFLVLWMAGWVNSHQLEVIDASSAYSVMI